MSQKERMAATNPEYLKRMQEQQKKQQQQEQQSQKKAVVGGMKKWTPKPAPKPQSQQEAVAGGLKKPLPKSVEQAKRDQQESEQYAREMTRDPRAEKLSPEERIVYQQYLGSMASASSEARSQREARLRKYNIKQTEGTIYSFKLGGSWRSLGGKELEQWEREQQDRFFEEFLPKYHAQKNIEKWSKTGILGVLTRPGYRVVRTDVPRDVQVSVEMQREFGVMSNFGRAVYGVVRPDIQQKRQIAAKRQVAAEAKAVSYWQRPVSGFEFKGAKAVKAPDYSDIPREEMAYFRPADPTKTMFKGTMEEFYKLPREVKQYYSPPVFVYNKEVYGEIEQQSPKQQKGLAQQILEFSPAKAAAAALGIKDEKRIANVERMMSQEQIGLTIFPSTRGAKGFLGGVVAPVESLAYVPLSLAGVKTPTAPPTFAGALISEAGAAVSGKGGGDTERLLKEYGPTYVAGSIAGEALLLSAGSSAYQKTLSGIAKRVPVVASPTAKGMVSRAAISGVTGGAVSGVFSGGDPEKILVGAGLGAGLSVGVELGAKGLSAVRAHLPKKLGGVERMVSGKPTVGKTGQQRETWVSSPQETLGGRKLRVVGDVTERPAGYYGVTTQSMVDDYVGQYVPTGHATLSPESFNLKVGGKTRLVGFPKMSAGFRKSQQLYQFYSAPGSKEFVTVYGGYAGIGEPYASESVKLVFGGKSAALVTTDTYVSPKMLKSPGESTKNYLSRTSGLSGKTGIAQETVLGKSAERQLVTSAAYKRFGTELPGSLFVSKGKVGTFQIKIEPKGLLGKIPVVKDIFSQYKTFGVYKGAYAPISGEVATAKSLNLASYGASYGKTASLPSAVAYTPSASYLISTKSVSPLQKTSKVVSYPKVVKEASPSIFAFQASKSIVGGTRSIPSESVKTSISSFPSVPSVPSFPDYPSASRVSSTKDVPSIPSYSVPSAPKVPSLRSTPSYKPPSYQPPSTPTSPRPSLSSSPPSKMASYPRYPDYPSSQPPKTTDAFLSPIIPAKRRKKRRSQAGLFGGWRKKTHPIPTVEQVSKNVVGIPIKRRKKGAKFTI